MALLPSFQTDDLTLSNMMSRWASILDPILQLPLNNSNFLLNIVLINGAVTFPHKLGRMQRGWVIADINGAASVYKSQPFNDKTLTLSSNAACTVSLVVF